MLHIQSRTDADNLTYTNMHPIQSFSNIKFNVSEISPSSSSPSPPLPIPPLKPKIQPNRHEQTSTENTRSPLVVILDHLPRPDGFAPVQIDAHSIQQTQDSEQGKRTRDNEARHGRLGPKVEQRHGYGTDVD